jgi:hypothetical protein
MYELEQGTKRLIGALERIDNIKALATILNYEPGQLEQDIQALSDYVRDKAADSEETIKPYGVYQVYTWDDVSYELIERYETKEQAEQMAAKLNKENQASFKPSETMSISPISYAVYSDVEYYNLMH